MAREQLAAALTAAVQRLAADGGQPPEPKSGSGVPFAEAIDWHRKRDALTDEEWRKRQDWYRRRSFTIANVTQLDLVSDVHRAIEKAIADGTTLDDFKKEVGEKLKAAWAGDVKNPAWRLEVIFRQNTLSSYGAGRYYQANDPAVLKRRPYWGLEVVVDDRTTKEICRPLVGTILPASDPWWRVHVPPLHMLCRTVLSTFTEEQAKKRGITTKPSLDPVQDGFGLAPDAIESDGPTGSRWYEQKLAKAPPKLAEVARAKQEMGPPPPPSEWNGGPRDGKPPPPWHMDGITRPTEPIDESDQKLSTNERWIAQHLAAQGNKLKALPKSIEDHERTPDVLCNIDKPGVADHTIEFTTVERKIGENTLYNRLREKARRRQSKNLIIDVRGTDFTRADALAAVARDRARTSKFSYIRILGDGFDVTFDVE